MRRNEANQDLRDMIIESGCFMWQIARRCGVQDTTFSKWMREEMPEDDPRRQMIIKVLKEIGQETG